MSVTTFNNALGMNLRREALEGMPSCVFKLRFDPLNAGYTFVWLIGVELILNHDYTLSGYTVTVVGKTITTSRWLKALREMFVYFEAQR